MTRHKSFYDVLNVAADADQSVIEAAYRALMKKYHPDRHASESGADDARAAEINQAYHALRDPDRRARYDAEERARRLARLPSVPAVYRPVPIEPRSRFGWKSFVAVLLPVVGGVYLASSMAAAPPEPGPAPTPAAADLGSQPDPAALDFVMPDVAAAPAQPVDRQEVLRAVAHFDRIEAAGGMARAAEYSAVCFSRQRQSKSVAELDHCIAFDEAASTFESIGTDPNDLVTSRFAPHMLSVRHINAARLVAEDHQWIEGRLAEIRSLATVALAETVGRRAGAAAAAEPEAAIVPLAATATAAGAAATNAVAKPLPRKRARSHYARREAARPRRPYRTARRAPAPAGQQAAAQPSAPRPRERSGDGDFLEREGGIY